MSPEVTDLLPPENVAELNRIPPAPAVLPTVDPDAVAVTSMFPVIVAEPMILNVVVLADLVPADAATQVTVGRVATVALVISVTVGVP